MSVPTLERPASPPLPPASDGTGVNDLVTATSTHRRGDAPALGAGWVGSAFALRYLRQ
jgi:hypothetical protein